MRQLKYQLVCINNRFLSATRLPFGCHVYKGLSGQGPVTPIIDFLASLD